MPKLYLRHLSMYILARSRLLVVPPTSTRPSPLLDWKMANYIYKFYDALSHVVIDFVLLA
jgi:hypothetical protein